MNVGDLCDRHVVTVTMDAPLSDVAQRMSTEHVGAMVVTAGDGYAMRVVGVITDRDIVRAQLERTSDLTSLSAGQTMTANPLVLEERESIEGAIAHLRARGVRRAPVVTAAGAPIGLISVDDLLMHLATTLVGAAAIVAQQVRKERA